MNDLTPDQQRVLEQLRDQYQAVSRALEAENNPRTRAQLETQLRQIEEDLGLARVGRYVVPDRNALVELLRGISGLSVDFANRIQNFLLSYLGTPANPVPFGGRHRQLQALDRWLLDEAAPPNALIAAEAGRGKSALLVRWSQSVIERGLARVIFVPVSIRFNTARADVALQALAARLGQIYGQPVRQAGLEKPSWQEVCLSYLNNPPPEGPPLLLIMDGLDEASDWRAGPDLLPTRPPANVRVVVSARYLAGDVDERSWLGRLRWDSPSLARSIPLPPLTRQGVSEVLAAMGHPLDDLATRVDVIGELFRLSRGDPLLVRLYVEALVGYGATAAALQPEDLPSIRDGVAGYFERWWDDQIELWRAQGRDPLVDRADVLEFFKLCATALGPLTRDDVAALAAGSLASGLRMRAIAAQVDRFIIGDGLARGYVFSHPRLGQYFYDELSQREREELEARFVGYAQHTLDDLNRGQLDPQDAPLYPVHYAGAHLVRAQAPAANLYKLLSRGWLAAWRSLEGTFTGFLSDAQRAWQAAEREGRLTTGGLAGEALAVQVRAALCHASVAALTAGIPVPLLLLARTAGVLTPVQALVIARQMPDERSRADALVALAPHLPEWMHEDLVEAVQAMERQAPKAWALANLGACLGAGALRLAIHAALGLEDPRHQAMALGSLIPCLPEDERPGLLDTAWTAAEELDDERQRARALQSLLPLVATDSPQAQRAFELGQATVDGRSRVRIFSGVAAVSTGDLRGQALRLGEETARAIEDATSRAVAFTELAPAVQGDAREEIARHALQLARGLDEKQRLRLLEELAPHLSPDLLVEALAAALDTGPEEEDDETPEDEDATANGEEAPEEGKTLDLAVVRDDLLNAVRFAVPTAGYDDEAVQALWPWIQNASQVLWEQLQGADVHQRLVELTILWSAPEAGAGVDRATAELDLAELAAEIYEALESTLPPSQDAPEGPALSDDTLHEVAERFLTDTLWRLRPEEVGVIVPWPPWWQRVDVHGAAILLAHLPPELAEWRERACQSMLQVAAETGESEREGALATIIPFLAGDQVQAAMELAAGIKDPPARLRAQARLLPALDEREQAALRALLLAEVDQLRHQVQQSEVLAELAARTPAEAQGPLIERALRAAQAIADEGEQVAVLAQLLESASGEGQLTAWQEVLDTTAAIVDPSQRMVILHSLAPKLPESLLPQALEMVVRIPYAGGYRDSALASLVPRLEGNRQLEALTALIGPGTATPLAWLDKELAALARYLPPDMALAVYEQAREIDNPEPLTRIVLALYPRLPERARPEALSLLRTALNAEILIGQLPALIQAMPEAWIDVAGQVASDSLDAWTAARLLARMARHADEAQAQAVERRTLDLMQELDDGAIAERLHRSRRYLSPGLAEAALVRARTMHDASIQALAIASLAPSLPAATAQAALADVIERLRGYSWLRPRTLVELARAAPPAFLPQLVELAQSLDNRRERIEALLDLTEQGPEELRQQAIETAVATLPDAEDWDWPELLARLAPLVDEGQRQHLAAMVLDMPNDGLKVACTRALLPQAPDADREHLLATSLAIIRRLSQETDQVRFLRELAERAPDEAGRSRIAAALPMLSRTAKQVTVLLELARRSSTEEERVAYLRQALATADAVPERGERVNALLQVAPALLPQQEMLEPCLAAVVEMRRFEQRVQGLSSLAPRLALWAGSHLAEGVKLWQRTLRSLAQHERPYLLAELRALLPFMLALSPGPERQEALRHLHDAVHDAGEWWP